MGRRYFYFYRESPSIAVKLCTKQVSYRKRAFSIKIIIFYRERSNSWMERCKSLIKNFERTLDNAKAKIDLCFVRLMLKRLALT